MNEATELAQLINQAITSRLAEVFTDLPGVVKSYDGSKRMAVVQPSVGEIVQDKDRDGRAARTVEVPPLIHNVPVHFLGTQETVICLPVKEGTPVSCHFTMRAIDMWAERGHLAEHDDPRRHDMSDCYCIPGLVHFNDPTVDWADSEDLLIRHQRTEAELVEMRLTPDGRLLASASSSVEVEATRIVKLAGATGFDATGTGGVSLLSTLRDLLTALQTNPPVSGTTHEWQKTIVTALTNALKALVAIQGETV